MYTGNAFNTNPFIYPPIQSANVPRKNGYTSFFLIPNNFTTHERSSNAVNNTQINLPTRKVQESFDSSTTDNESNLILPENYLVYRSVTVLDRRNQVGRAQQSNGSEVNGRNQPIFRGPSAEPSACLSTPSCVQSCGQNANSGPTPWNVPSVVSANPSQGRATALSNEWVPPPCEAVSSCRESCVGSLRRQPSRATRQPQQSVKPVSYSLSPVSYSSSFPKSRVRANVPGETGSLCFCNRYSGQRLIQKTSSRGKKSLEAPSRCEETPTCVDSCVFKREQDRLKTIQRQASCEVTPSCRNTCVESANARGRRDPVDIACDNHPPCVESCLRNQSTEIRVPIDSDSQSGLSRQGEFQTGYVPSPYQETATYPNLESSSSSRRQISAQLVSNKSQVRSTYRSAKTAKRSFKRGPHNLGDCEECKIEISGREYCPNEKECCTSTQRSCRGRHRHTRSCRAQKSLTNPYCSPRCNLKPPWDSGDGPSCASVQAKVKAAARALRARQYSDAVRAMNKVPVSSSKSDLYSVWADGNEDEDSNGKSRSCHGVTRHEDDCRAYNELVASLARNAEDERLKSASNTTANYNGEGYKLDRKSTDNYNGERWKSSRKNTNYNGKGFITGPTTIDNWNCECLRLAPTNNNNYKGNRLISVRAKSCINHCPSLRSARINRGNCNCNCNWDSSRCPGNNADCVNNKSLSQFTVYNVDSTSTTKNIEKNPEIGKETLEECMKYIQNETIRRGFEKYNLPISHSETFVNCLPQINVLNSIMAGKGNGKGTQMEEMENDEQSLFPCIPRNALPESQLHETVYGKRILRSIRAYSASKKINSAGSSTRRRKKDFGSKKQSLRSKEQITECDCRFFKDGDNKTFTTDQKFNNTQSRQSYTVDDSSLSTCNGSIAAATPFPYSTSVVYVSKRRKDNIVSQGCSIQNSNTRRTMDLGNKEDTCILKNALMSLPSEKMNSSGMRPINIKIKASSDFHMEGKKHNINPWLTNSKSKSFTYRPESKINELHHLLSRKEDQDVKCNCLQSISSFASHNTTTTTTQDNTKEDSSNIKNNDIEREELAAEPPSVNSDVQNVYQQGHSSKKIIISDPSHPYHTRADKEVSEGKMNGLNKEITSSNDIQTSTTELRAVNKGNNRGQTKRRSAESKRFGHDKKIDAFISSSEASDVQEDTDQSCEKRKNDTDKPKVLRVRNASCTAKLGPRYEQDSVNYTHQKGCHSQNPLYYATYCPLFHGIPTVPAYASVPIMQNMKVTDFRQYQPNIAVVNYPKSTKEGTCQTDMRPFLRKIMTSQFTKNRTKKLSADVSSRLFSAQTQGPLKRREVRRFYRESTEPVKNNKKNAVDPQLNGYGAFSGNEDTAMNSNGFYNTMQEMYPPPSDPRAPLERCKGTENISIWSISDTKKKTKYPRGTADLDSKAVLRKLLRLRANRQSTSKANIENGINNDGHSSTGWVFNKPNLHPSHFEPSGALENKENIFPGTFVNCNVDECNRSNVGKLYYSLHCSQHYQQIPSTKFTQPQVSISEYQQMSTKDGKTLRKVSEPFSAKTTYSAVNQQAKDISSLSRASYNSVSGFQERELGSRKSSKTEQVQTDDLVHTREYGTSTINNVNDSPSGAYPMNFLPKASSHFLLYPHIIPIINEPNPTIKFLRK